MSKGFDNIKIDNECSKEFNILMGINNKFNVVHLALNKGDKGFLLVDLLLLLYSVYFVVKLCYDTLFSNTQDIAEYLFFSDTVYRFIFLMVFVSIARIFIISFYQRYDKSNKSVPTIFEVNNKFHGVTKAISLAFAVLLILINLAPQYSTAVLAVGSYKIVNKVFTSSVNKLHVILLLCVQVIFVVLSSIISWGVHMILSSSVVYQANLQRAFESINSLSENTSFEKPSHIGVLILTCTLYLIFDTIGDFAVSAYIKRKGV